MTIDETGPWDSAAFDTLDVALLPPDLPLTVLGKGLFFGILECEKMLGAKVPDIPKDTDITGAQAVDIMRNMAFNLFPGLRS
jgi:hypothetical protein